MTKHSCMSIVWGVFIMTLVCAGQSFAHGDITGINEGSTQQIVSNDSNELLIAGRIKRPVRRFQPFPKAPVLNPVIEEGLLMAGKKKKGGTSGRINRILSFPKAPTERPANDVGGILL